ncbi:ankyrin repeat domain-containing protein [Spirosoma pomorum]|jgi:ankyrin repeat protein
MPVVKKDRLSNDVVSGVYALDLSKSDFTAFAEFILLTDKDGRTLLIHAVLAKHLALVSWLTANAANIEHSDKLGWTALHYAAQGHQASILEVLLSVHPAVDLQDEYGNTPLWRATFDSRGVGDLIKLLLQAGANPYLKNHLGISPYDLALTIANYDVKPFFADFA